jgi:hypothetical protein
MKTKDEILELIEDRYFQLILDNIRLEKSQDIFERESIILKCSHVKGMINAYTYVISDNEIESENISQKQLKLAFERFSRTLLATDVNITNLKKLLNI